MNMSVLFISGSEIVIIALVVAGAGAAKMASQPEEGEESEIRSILKQVEENRIWVLRNVWSANAQTGQGYYAKREGWRFQFP